MASQPNPLASASALSTAVHQTPAIVPFSPPAPHGLREHVVEALARPKPASGASGGIQWSAWTQAVLALMAFSSIGAAMLVGWTWLVAHAVYIFGPGFIVLSAMLMFLIQGMRIRN